MDGHDSLLSFSALCAFDFQVSCVSFSRAVLYSLLRFSSPLTISVVSLYLSSFLTEKLEL